MKKTEGTGYIYILIGTTLWGVSSVVAKSLFIIGLPPAELVQIRLTLATVTLLLILLIFDRKRIIISYHDLPYFFVLGFVGVAGVQFTYYYTISKIHVGPAVLIQYLSPVWIALYAFFSRKNPSRRRKIAALLLALLGCYLHRGRISIGPFKIKPDRDCERPDLFALFFLLCPLRREGTEKVRLRGPSFFMVLGSARSFTGFLSHRSR